MAFALAYLGLASFVIFCVFVGYTGEINQVSKSLQERMRQMASAEPIGDWKLFRKIVEREIRSMRELRIMAGSTFFYDKPMLLTAADIVLGQSVNLLVMN